jgi:hypothetical protein
MSFSTREAAPPVTDIVGGSTFSDGGTVITIPSGRIWSGTVQLSAYAIWKGGASEDQSQAAPTVTVQGTGSVPSSGSLIAHLYLCLTELEKPVTDHVSEKVVIAAPSGAVILRLNLQGASGATAIATGQLL